ncbi:MAG: CBS domain-containing protein [Rhodoplanes sp.]
MTVADILAGKRGPVLTVQPTQTIAALAERLRSARVGVMIVSKDGESLEGIISERDVAYGLAKHGAALSELRVS